MKTLLALLFLIPSLSWGSLVGKKIVCITENEYVSGYVKGYSFVSNDEVLHYWGIVFEPWIGSFDYKYLANSDLIFIHEKIERLKDYPLLPQDRPKIIALFTTKDLILYDEYHLIEKREFTDPTFKQRTEKGECSFIQDEISEKKFVEMLSQISKTRLIKQGEI